MIPLTLTYDPESLHKYEGWYLPGTSLDDWLTAVVDEPAASTRYYLAPRSLVGQGVSGLIALREPASAGSTSIQTDSLTTACPVGAIPLWRRKYAPRDLQLWLPLCARTSQDVSLDQLLSDQDVADSKTYVWLPPDTDGRQRMLRIRDEDEIDLSLLIRPTQSITQERPWRKPPGYHALPEQIQGLQIHPDMIPPNPFGAEQAAIGGESDDLMSLDDNGNVSGGSPISMAKRFFRKSLEALAKKMSAPQQKKDSAEPQPPQSPAAGSAASPTASTGSGMSGGMAMSQWLQNMLADQRNQQIKRLLDLMKRDPDRALKLAPPMNNLGAPRGLAQPGSILNENEVNFSLAGLFGGGKAVDYWQFDPTLQTELINAYRQQAAREVAAGRFRRAAYIYAQLLGDVLAAARVLERGKFYLEAAQLYEYLQQRADQARCLRLSGQLAEAAELYETLSDFDSAAEIWTSIGDQAAARRAYERAVEAAIAKCDILTAAEILEGKLSDATAAEQLLWAQWPRGHQVVDCMQKAFKRLADQSRHTEAHRQLDAIIQAAHNSDQTLLARVCVELHRYFPDVALRQRAEDQCRVSVANRLRFTPQGELQARMKILRSLHPDDLLLQRDIRRYERELAESELTVRPQGQGQHLHALPPAHLQTNRYLAAMMIHQQLFVVWRSDHRINCGRYAHTLEPEPIVMHSGWELHYTEGEVIYCRLQRGSDPAQIVVAYGQSGSQSCLLTSPLGGDDFWLVKWVAKGNGVLAGVNDDGSQWWWDPYHQVLVRAQEGGLVPNIIQLSEFLQTRTVQQAAAITNSDFADWSPDRDTAEVLGGQPFISHGNSIVSVRNKIPYELAWLPEPIHWMLPSPPMTMPRLLVATASGLYTISTNSSVRPEKISQDETFTTGSFLSTGRIAAATATHLVLFQNNGHAFVAIDNCPLIDSDPIAVLQLSPGTVGVLFKTGCLQRWQIR